MEKTNEPVAWMDEINTFVLDKDYKQFPKNLQNGMIPLYIHPAKILTDEEIIEIYKKVYEEKHDNQVIALARAILKKASEK
jgi:hypothetical protein